MLYLQLRPSLTDTHFSHFALKLTTFYEEEPGPFHLFQYGRMRHGSAEAVCRSVRCGRFVFQDAAAQRVERMGFRDWETSWISIPVCGTLDNVNWSGLDKYIEGIGVWDDRLSHRIVHLFVCVISIYFEPALCLACVGHQV